MTKQGVKIFVEAVLEFTDRYYAELNHLSFEQTETFTGQLLRLKYVDKTCIDHVCSVVACFKTSDFEVAKNRADHLQWQINGLISRWAKVKGK